MANKKINELAQAINVEDTDLFLIETANGTRSIPYSKLYKNNDFSVNTTSNSTALGYNTNAPGAYSTALGVRANASGNYSTALGSSVSTFGDYSTALGYNTSTSGVYSTVLGSSAIAGNSATALGSSANASGNYSIALGYYTNASGNSATALGGSANGNSATALGSSANASGNDSTALGSSANASVRRSTALGSSANASGNYSTALGYSASASGDYSTALGYAASTSNSNSIQLGSATNLSSITSKVAITVTSDERDKTDINDIEDGAIDFLKNIRPIRYLFNGRELYIDEENLSDEERLKKEKYGLCAYDREQHALGTKKGNRIRVGVLAQNVQEMLKKVYGDSSYANLVNDNLFDMDSDDIPEGVENQLAVNYEGFIPFLIKAVQELDAKLEMLAKEKGKELS